MAEPVLVPPTPTINQTDSPQQIAETVKNVQSIFDRVAPDPSPRTAANKPTEAPVAPPTTVPEPVTTPPPTEIPKTPDPTPSAPPTSVEPVKLPSFIEQALKGETTSPTPPEDAFPETPPEFKTPEERNQKYKAWRSEYQKLKDEVKTLRERPSLDPQTTEKLTFLENQNKELNTQLSRFNVEGNRQFQTEVIMPMQRAWQEAAKIVNEAGGDPDRLARAVSMPGKAQYEAIDEALAGLPESAKIEAHNAIAAYRRFDDVRRNALANPEKTAAELQKVQIARQQEMIAKQKTEMGTLFDEAVRKLRDEAGVEVLKTSSDPDARAWNDNAESLVKTARALFLDNSDMGRMAMACVLAPMADSYRKMWFAERQAHEATKKTLSEKFGSEPSLSESGGAARSPNGQRSVQEDLKRPFTQVFMEEFHRQQGR